VKLPFLKPKTWPKLRKLSGESRYGFSENDELIEHALGELIESIEQKDHVGVIEAIRSLIHCIQEEEGEDAPDSFEDAQGV
jgi:hypothetical protein